MSISDKRSRHFLGSAGFLLVLNRHGPLFHKREITTLLINPRIPVGISCSDRSCAIYKCHAICQARHDWPIKKAIAENLAGINHYPRPTWNMELQSAFCPSSESAARKNKLRCSSSLPSVGYGWLLQSSRWHSQHLLAASKLDRTPMGRRMALLLRLRSFSSIW